MTLNSPYLYKKYHSWAIVRFQFQSSNFNVVTDGLHTWPINIKGNYLKDIFNRLKTVLNLNPNFHLKTVFSLTLSMPVKIGSFEGSN